MTSELALFLLAHPDDEVFVSHHLQQTQKESSSIIIYLTDGGDASERRQHESLAYLRSLGVRDEQVHFLGHEFKISDGLLMDRLPEAYLRLREKLGTRRPSAIFGPAWEGGHRDHDALHLLMAALARHWSVLENAWQFPLYNGEGRPGLFFRVMTLLRDTPSEREGRWGWVAGLKRCRAVFAYPSQRITWLGLGPQSLWHFLVKRRETLARVNLSRLARAPHVGRLLYERYGACTFVEFQARTSNFYAQYLA